MVSLSSIEKDFIATTRYSFKDCILAYKISNQMHANFEKKKFHKQSVVILLKNGCSVKHVLYNIYSFICGKSLENTFEAWPTKYYCI